MTRQVKGPEHRLAVYGSLAPGEVNAGVLDGLAGDWIEGTVTGELLDHGWGTGLGFPALRYDPDGPPVAVKVFVSHDLPNHWWRLDAFEGPGYERIVVPVALASGETMMTQLYAAVE